MKRFIMPPLQIARKILSNSPFSRSQSRERAGVLPEYNDASIDLAGLVIK